MNTKLQAKIGLLLLCVLVTTSCVKSYDVDTFVKPQVVLNSLLTPDSDIKIDLYWSRNVKDTSSILDHANRVVGAKVVLKENDIIIAEIISRDTTLVVNHRPKVGARYDITAETAGEPLLRASTTMPQAPDATCTFIKRRGDFRHYRIENVKTNNDTPSLLLGIRTYTTTNEEIGNNINIAGGTYSKVYAIAQYADKFNVERDNSYVETSGSIERYKYLMRTESQNIDRVYPINFSALPYESIIIPGAPEREYSTSNPTYYRYYKTVLIAPSIDYDKYYTTVTSWKINREQVNIFNTQVIKIHSNIKGGLGIFAAYNQKTFTFKYSY